MLDVCLSVAAGRHKDPPVEKTQSRLYLCSFQTPKVITGTQPAVKHAAKAASAYITFLAGCGAFWEREACAVFWVLTVISDKEQNSEGHRPETACVPGVFSRAVKHDVYKQRFAPDE